MNPDPDDVTIECLQGDIARQPDVEAIVNAANAQLRIGGGVAGAIHRAAGPGLEEECRPFAPIQPGEAVITGGHELPNRHVIHCLGPVYGVDKPADWLLASCYRNALQLAEQHGIRSLAFPAISTGAFGYPIEPTAHIEQPETRAAYERYEVPVEALEDRVCQVVESVFGARRIVIFLGGPREEDEQPSENVLGIRDGGGFGSIIGRNAFQRPRDEALRLLRTFMDIYSGTAS